MSRREQSSELRALVLAPRGRDALIACSLIKQAGVAASTSRDLPELVVSLSDEVAFALITEEAIHEADLRALVDWIERQPAWSDLPIILLTNHGGGPERNPVAARWLEGLGNVSFIERPFHPTTLVSVARTALNGRRRQHETRDLLAQFHEGEARLRTALRAGRLQTWELDFAADRPATSEAFLSDIESVLGPVHAEDRTRVAKAFRQSLRTGEDCVIEFRRLGPGDEVYWIDVRACLLRDGKGRPLRLIGLFSDITARKSAEQALLHMKDELERRVVERTGELQRAHDQLVAHIAERERTEEQLRHMQKLESIGQLTGGVAHDFNNLLTAVLGNLELLRKRVPGDPSIDRLVDGAMQGAQRGAALTQRLLAFARRQALEPKPVDLAQLVSNMSDLLRRSIGPRTEMAFDLPSGLPTARADANQIELALLNLAVNARDAMPNGGRVSIALDVAESGAAQDLAAGRYVRLSVTDTGHGMDGETLRRAIEPFFSTKEIGKGTGLGLSMIHGLALQLGGALRLQSAQGRGTRAELWLPVVEAPVPTTASDQPGPHREGKNKQATLLYVDDDFLIALSTAALLEDLGHTVIRANSGAMALDLLRKGEAVDLLITDYAMPNMTGVQLAEEARKLRPGLPILLATGYSDVPARSKLDLPRVSKPYSQKQLAEHITALIG